MSLLEDVFLHDEAGEAQELERVIEGDEFEERPRSPLNSDDNSEKEDEAVEDKRRVDPNAKAKRVVKNPRFILNPARLTGPRGIQVIPEHFKDFKFKGKGHEKEDLDMVLKKLEHWAYRLYPKFQFEDCLKKIETLGKKRPVMVHLHKIRSDQFLSEETVVQKDSSDEEAPEPMPEEDEFDKLLQQQIDLARVTPAPGSVKKPGFGTPSVDRRSSLTMPKATSSPSISDEQKERMIRNRKLAEERRLARLKQNTTINLVDKSNSIEEEPITIDDTVEVRSNIVNDVQNDDFVIEITEKDSNLSDTEVNVDTVRAKKVNRSNVIDSDEESATGNSLVIDMAEQSESKKSDTRKHMSDTEVNIDTVRAKKINRSDVIDSGEESDAGNNLVIDMTEQSELSPKKSDTRKNKSNTIKSGDETNIVIDITEGLNNQPKVLPVTSNTVIDLTDIRLEVKRNEQNDDSSDDEDVPVIQSVSVDVHVNRNVNHDTNGNAEITKATTNIGGDNVIETESEMNGITKYVDGNETEITYEHDKENIETNGVEVEKDLKEKAKNDETNYKDIDNEIDNKIDSNSKMQDGKENIDSNVLQSEVQELMDVDFSDDF